MTVKWLNLRAGVVRHGRDGAVRSRNPSEARPQWRTESGKVADSRAMTSAAREQLAKWAERAIVPPAGTDITDAEGNVVGTVGEGEHVDALGWWVWRHDGHEWIRVGRVRDVAARLGTDAPEQLLGAPAGRAPDIERARLVRAAYKYVSDKYQILGKMERVEAAAHLVAEYTGAEVSSDAAWRIIGPDEDE